MTIVRLLTNCITAAIEAWVVSHKSLRLLGRCWMCGGLVFLRSDEQMLRWVAAMISLACQPTLLAAERFGTEINSVFAAADCWCQWHSNEPIETDRHDFTQSTRTVGRGVSQLEFGYLYSYRDKEDEIEHTHVTPELVLRYGLTDELVENYFNIGVDFLVNDDFVIDFRIGKGLSGDAEDFFVGASGGLRFR
jgi:hypothetical protein